MKKNIILGTVLSGGKSSRMGKDKGLMHFRNQPLITYSISVLQKVTKDIVISTSELKYEQFGFPLIADLIPNIGPIGGLYSVMKQVESDKYFIVACDMPNTSESFAKELIQYCSHFDIVVPIHNNTIEPLWGIYSRNILPIVEEQINKGDYKLINLLELCKTKYVESTYFPEIKTDNFKNINTPKDAKQ
jgi:molybdenum cofactor guanylyltransferase